MALSRIIISETNDEQVIVLKEVDGDRAFPIVIGIWEAVAIDRNIKKKTPAPRPTISSRTSSRGSAARSTGSS
jgi:bifunctional DNase/RNase